VRACNIQTPLFVADDVHPHVSSFLLKTLPGTMTNYPFSIYNLEQLPPEQHEGETGTSTWRTLQLPGLRVRLVDYSPGYLADHWCTKGHIVYCIEGSVETRLGDGQASVLTAGMCYVVSDDMSSHQSYSREGVKLLIIDGDFLAVTNN
jgi:hypothetical protein